MEFSSKGRYGLRLMIELAHAYGRGVLSLAEVAHKQGLPLGYLEQLMARLRQAGLVASERGIKGGYRLSASPESITIGEVLRALEGPIAPARCATPQGCRREPVCPSTLVWHKIRDTVAQVLNSTTLADICCYPVTATPAAVLQGDECR
ncbi:MAG TPA: Rrf2 family transcriptional regulator [Dehalococcoidia bacterium]|nr:Rrf2 family transcriptional regulator [Dehalococcoidia bacterium]